MKKGYFFLMDGIFAIVILVIGGLIVSSNTVRETSEIPLTMFLDNSVELLSSVKINELCNDECFCSNKKLQEFCKNGLILNKGQTLIDYMGELYSQGDNLKISDLFANLTLENNMFRQDVFSVELKIDDETIYFQGKTQEESKDLMSSKKVIFGYYELPTGIVEFWGPYIAEVNIWN